MLQSLLVLCLVMPVAAPRIRVEHTTDSLAKILELVTDEKAILVDVRTTEEWVQGHAAAALHVPSDSLRKHSLDRERLAKTLPKDKPVYTYCQVGMRSKQAAAILIREGYDARAMKPGYEELLAAGFENEVGPREPAPDAE
ncbi:Thiosulfate sulfurtransferase GlpE [Botrimarina colliarenosi]|uniref:Thiosulfate sulfurtransferase GlpE n=1 Tax=Botrimarina colliarenosi TaxID=2528001 RepID=A0A5C6A7C2_9BACT|nr:rhodanese-like domain-containing protein [Botrimarina colliarenosi]TWT95814.1 Thiosulfate sulfurtransferase GlpE [Botrimarina colliarenosi]